jgi:hypothetical protein
MKWFYGDAAAVFSSQQCVSVQDRRSRAPVLAEGTNQQITPGVNTADLVVAPRWIVWPSHT